MRKLILSVFVMTVIGTGAYAYFVHDQVCERGEGTAATRTLRKCDERQYSVVVDYDKSLMELIRDSDLSTYGSGSFTHKFPHDGAGKAKRRFQLISLNPSPVTLTQALAGLQRPGQRPATAKELVAFVAKYPKILRHRPVVAVGTIVEESAGFSSIAAAEWRDGYGGGATIDEMFQDGDRPIGSGYLFLVVQE